MHLVLEIFLLVKPQEETDESGVHLDCPLAIAVITQQREQILASALAQRHQCPAARLGPVNQIGRAHV